MYIYTILKKISILLVSLVAIAFLVNCSGSSSSGGGGGSNDNDTKKPPVEKAPEKTCGENEVLNEDTNQCEPALPACGENEMLNENTNQCEPVLPICDENQFLIERECKDKVIFEEPAAATCDGDLALSVEINNEEKCLTEDDSMFDFHVAVSGEGDERKWENSNIEISLAANNATLTVQNCEIVSVSEDTLSTFTAEFSSYFSCEILAANKDDTDQQVTYALNVVHDISQASDFEIPFFETAAARFALTDDITLEAQSESIVDNFKGQLDGANHTISELSIDAAGTNSSDNIGFIGSMILEGDATVVIKNLKLNVKKLTGRNFVAGLIAKLESADSNVRNLQISDVTVTFSNAEVECVSSCAGVIGQSNYNAKAELSNVRVNGTLTIVGDLTDTTVSYVGGIIGSSDKDQLTNVAANLRIKISKPATYVGLVVGQGKNINIKNVIASGTMNLDGPSESIGGVVGFLTESSRIEQAKSILTVSGQNGVNLKRDDLSNVGGTVGFAAKSQLDYIYSQLTATAFRWHAVGGVVGSLLDSQVTYAVGNGSATATTEANLRYGGLVGVAGGVFSLSHVFSTGNIEFPNDAGGSNSYIGQMVGFIMHKMDGSVTQFDIDNCYTNGFSASADNAKQKNPETVLGKMVPNYKIKATVTKCYTAAEDLLRVDSADGQTTDSYSLNTEDVVTGVMSANAASLGAFDGAEGWTKEQSGISYTYPMLAYPDSMQDGPVSEADWFEFQIQVNEQ